MKKTPFILTTTITATFLCLLLGFGVTSCRPHGHDDEHGHGHGHGHDEGHDDHGPEGPHGGRLLTQGDFAIEVIIAEDGIPPEFRVYPMEKSAPVRLEEVSLEAELRRFAGVVQKIPFEIRGDYLRGSSEIYEPHSFEAHFKATFKGQTMEWSYLSEEGRTQLSDAALLESGVKVEKAGPQTLALGLDVQAQITPDPARTSHIHPRFDGLTTTVYRNLGDSVGAGSALAIIESNHSLSAYALRSPISGTIIEQHLAPGEYVDAARTAYTVADLSKLWVKAVVYAKDLGGVAVGQTLLLPGGEGGDDVQIVIDYVHPVVDPLTQSTFVRGLLDNKDGRFRVGNITGAKLLTARVDVPIAVRKEAIQSFRDWQVVFMRYEDLFEVKPLTLGRDDGEWVEVLSGLESGMPYASHGSFVIKADILKAGASHDH